MATAHRPGGVSMLPDSSEQRMSGKSVAGGGAFVVVLPLISRIEEQCCKIHTSTM